MVKKLLKHEFIYYIRTLGIFLPIMLSVAIITRVITLVANDSTLGNMAALSAHATLILGVIALMLFSTVIGIIRFYKNLYSQEGYLSFTLPVSNHQHIFAKLLMAMASNLAAGLTSALAILIAMPDAVSDFFCELKLLFTPTLSGAHPVNIVFYIIECLLLGIISLASMPLLYYACVTIGQSAKKNRIFMSFAVYFIYYLITQAISTVLLSVLLVMLAGGSLDGILMFIERSPFVFIHIVLITLIILSSALSSLYYFVTFKFMSKKLNLE